MVKRKLDLPSESTKKRRLSIISSKDANPSDSNGFAQCFKTVTAKMHVCVPPSSAADPVLGIRKSHLDRLVMTYFAPAEGVVIAHQNMKLLGQDTEGTGAPVAKIMNDSPFSYLWIQSDFLVWSPASGDHIEGWVSVQSPGHIALLIHDTFNATIKRADIPETWQFVHSEDDETDSKSLGYWVDSNGNRIEGKLAFDVKTFNVSGRTPLVVGSLLTVKDVQLPTIEKTPIASVPEEAIAEDEDDDDDDAVVAVAPNSSDEESDSDSSSSAHSDDN
ncbi:DNA-directed RNA polymerase I subunit RPA43 [Wickerhamiella sorbophila]|uniref:DNA-directed RNA polymerase subunit n=1 Tax=Wickerhamiella sorbophila TaxID=45607 RepID=A0A2T0FL00_9ASCO|nr:DNA-directed RNA polymerase I subunit RPA43 [Wickerhamiella sorbophila]PRT55659.1 DNA-directed RNA polymerase I subunit RPA43 [Wickerhamiella sorbophila]